MPIDPDPTFAILDEQASRIAFELANSGLTLDEVRRMGPEILRQLEGEDERKRN